MVVERGASLLVSEQAETENFDETVTVAQMRDESPDEFSDRIVGRIGAAAHSDPFREVLLFASRACEHATLSARRLIALAIAGHAEATCSPAELVVVASADASRAEREPLLELADDLIFSAQGTSLPVRFRFIAVAGQAAPFEVPEPAANTRELPALPIRRCVQPGTAVGERGRHG
jgi:hypothetical protein